MLAYASSIILLALVVLILAIENYFSVGQPATS